MMSFLGKFLQRKFLFTLVLGIVIPLLGSFLDQVSTFLHQNWPFVAGVYALVALWIVLEYVQDSSKSLAIELRKLRDELKRAGFEDQEVRELLAAFIRTGGKEVNHERP